MILDMNKVLFINVLLFVTRTLVIFIVNIKLVVDIPSHKVNFKFISFEFANEIH